MLANIFQNEAVRTKGVTFSQLNDYCEILRGKLSAAGGLWLDYSEKAIREIAYDQPSLLEIEGSRIYLNNEDGSEVEALFQNISRYSPEQQHILKENALLVCPLS
jgi:hypothetical protein